MRLSILLSLTNLYYDVTNPTSTMTSLISQLCYYDVTNPATMTSLIPLLWRHLPRYYDVTNPATMTSLTPLLWRHLPRYYDVTNPATMTSLPHMASLRPRHWCQHPDYYSNDPATRNKRRSNRARQTFSPLTTLLWRHNLPCNISIMTPQPSL